MKTAKWIVILLNIIIGIIAYQWWESDKSFEPIIVILGQLVSIITLGLEQTGTINTKGVRNKSKINYEVSASTNIQTEDIDDSEITIKNK